ncbi:hypothetical protein C8P63_11745 [Melghirimyces profundicolus]|uniref:Uncharacterized protein n=1 Tax=Melghirimyces profundicolus TaxID=1242148 RepID=A0A2T6BQF3_9BACL|nr:hypothetical protein [Melghirimyces profundicolus]PTX58298.1 hypothetical protein C8P63_11745 [Melghirimyces profundicolus]
MQPMPHRRPEERNRALEHPRFSGDFIWKFMGAFFASAVMWTGKMGEWVRYGATLVTVLFFTPVWNGDFRQVWANHPAVALVYVALIVLILSQSAARKMCERDSHFYSPFAEYLFNRKQFDERRKWEKEKGGSEEWRARVKELKSRLKETGQENEKLKERLANGKEKLEQSVRLAAKLRGEVRLYEVMLQGGHPVAPHLLMERVLKEMDPACVAVACYESEGDTLRLRGSAGAWFELSFHLEADADCPETESWATGADIVSQNEAYPYEYMVTAVFRSGLFVLMFRLDTLDLDEATPALCDIMLENKHLLLVASRILNTRRQETSVNRG